MLFSSKLQKNAESLELGEFEQLPLEGNSNGKFFSDTVNMRVSPKGHRLRLSPRFGSKALSLDLGGTPARTYAFSTSLPEGVFKMLAVQLNTVDGTTVKLFRVDTNELITISGIDPSITGIIDFISIGRFLYLFTDEMSVYVDLTAIGSSNPVTLPSYTWMATAAKNPLTPSITGRTQDVSEDVPFTYSEGTRVIVFPNFASAIEASLVIVSQTPTPYERYINQTDFNDELNEFNTIESNTITVQAWLLKAGKRYHYIPTGPGYIEVGPMRTVYDTQTIIEPLFDMQAFDFGETGSNQQIFEEISFSSRYGNPADPFMSSVKRVSTTAGFQVFVTDQEGVEYSVTEIDAVYRAVPYSADTDPLLSMGTQYYQSASGAVISDDEYTEPSLYRGYKTVDVLDDGSVTLPSMSAVSRVPLSEIASDTGILQAISVTIPAPDTNVVSRYVYATRWLTDEKMLFTNSSERYPNGAYYFHSAVPASGEVVFTDNKPDQQLVVPMSSDVPMIGGIPTLIAPGKTGSGITPSASTSIKGSMIIAGPTLHRPCPVDGRNIAVTETGVAGVGSRELRTFFRYNDGKYSDPLSTTVNNGQSYAITIGGLNMQVDSIEQFMEEAGVWMLVNSFSQGDPEFNGYVFDVVYADYDDGQEKAVPDGTDIQVDLALDSYVTVMLPPQNTTLTQINKVNGNNRVTKIFAVDLDSSPTVTRYKVLALTSENIQIGSVEYNENFLKMDFTTLKDGMSYSDIRSVKPLGSGIVMTTKKGLVVADRRGVNDILSIDEVIDPENQELLLSNVNGIAYNDRDAELLLATGTKYVIVAKQGSGFRLYKYAEKIHGLNNIDGKILGIQENTAGDNSVVYQIEDEQELEAVSAELITLELGDAVRNSRIIEAAIMGQNLTVQVQVDLSEAANEGSVNSWADTFTPSYSTAILPLSMKGVYLPLQGQGKLPRLKFILAGTSSGSVEAIQIKQRTLANKSRGRF